MHARVGSFVKQVVQTPKTAFPGWVSAGFEVIVLYVGE